MSSETDRSAPDTQDWSWSYGGGFAPENGQAGAAESGLAGPPPYGWYYYGPEAPMMQTGGPAGPAGWGGPSPHGGHGPAGVQSHDESADLKDAFERLSRGDVSAESIARLFGMDDKEFWKGALFGAAAALLVSNLPAVKTMVAAGAAKFAAGAGGTGESDGQGAGKQTGGGGPKPKKETES